MSDDTTPPKKIGPLPQIEGYRLLREIGRGGMSTVYLAEQTALGREVALKVMAAHALADEISRRRFENEVRTIARLEHPHIVRIHELGRTLDGVPFYSMPYLSRGHLGDRDFTGNEAGAVAIAKALLSALEYAHSRGVVHRDVKAENVLFDEAGRPLLADFGIALRRGFGPRVTAAGLAVGSTAYMAPEQARGEGVDGRADLYSLGVLLWEMLAGGLPYQADDALSMALMHARDPIPKLPAHLRHWQRFMQRALAKQPGQRFQNAAEMREAMLAVRPSRWRPAVDRARAVSRSRGARAGAIVAGGLAVVVTGILLWPRMDDDGFFRTAPAPAQEAVEVAAPDPVDAMLAPLPQATLDTALANALRQIEGGDLVSPPDANAMTSILAAWHVDRTDPRVHEATARLFNALGQRVGTLVGAGADARAIELATRSAEFAEATGQAGAPAQAAMQETVAKALQSRLQAALDRRNRRGAERTISLARELGLPAAGITALEKTLAAGGARGSRTDGQTVASAPGRGRVAERPVSRAEYARFAKATRREASLCRERVSLLRVFAPRSWEAPGFEQSPSDPVVCVSFRDAEAYAYWLGQQTGHEYRLPTAEESGSNAPTLGKRTIGLWLQDCGRDCLHRVVTAGSWRGREAQRPLQAARGYDDVGFRLVRER